MPATPTPSGRPRGRPRLVIDEDELLGAVEHLLREGGIDGVSIERVAEELGLSRATLYRSISSKEQLLGRLLRRMNDELTAEALAVGGADGRTARERLNALIRAQVKAAIRARAYLFVFIGRDWLEEDVYDEWRRFTREFEAIWVGVVQDAIDEGSITVTNPTVATRLLLGMLIWISRWYRPDRDDGEEIAAEAIRLLGGTP